MTVERLILLADSDIEVARRLARVARSEGFEVITAKKGLEVIPMAVTSQPSLIVLDVVFPDADGRDLLKEIRLDPRVADIPVLMWSERDYESDRLIALELGAQDYLRKSPPALLLPRIARILNNKPRVAAANPEGAAVPSRGGDDPRCGLIERRP